MLSVESLTVEFSARPLFADISFLATERDRIALVGKNGAGKSTLLKIIAGLQQPSSGQVNMTAGTRIGYLPQVMVLADDTTVRQETRKAFAEMVELKAEVERLSEEMASRDDYDTAEYQRLVERFTSRHERYMLLGGDNYEADIERTLVGLGFMREDFDRPTSEFSGGWRMRIELAKILLGKPDILLLDEPTNHLDIESILWLEQFLTGQAKTLILVSHDRAFINNVTNRTMELSCGRLADYRVPYDQYVMLREERREAQLRAYENQQREIADMKDFIERFRYKPTKAVQVQSRIKQLEKIVPIEVDEVDRSVFHLKFPPCLRSGDYPLICDEVAKSYGQHCVFHDVSLTIKRGEKVAFVGRNGEGKSTLVKCIMGEIDFTGSLKVGHNVQIGYFAQNQAQLLDEELTVFDTIDRVARGDMRTKVRNILGSFMFGGDAIDKKVKVLSGGERSRLAMIRLLLEPVNFLILDEPTNHLDMLSKDVLKAAIKAFDGTAIIVSHDREFLDGLVEKVYEFGGGRVREHLGGIYDFLASRGIDNLNQLGTHEATSAAPTKDKAHPFPSPAGGNMEGVSSSSSPTGVAHEGISYEQRKQLQRQISRLDKSVKGLENRISELEAKLKELDDTLCKPENASNMALVTQYTDTQAELNKLEEQWETDSLQLEELQQKLVNQ